jgi:hypothetical protein
MSLSTLTPAETKLFRDVSNRFDEVANKLEGVKEPVQEENPDWATLTESSYNIYTGMRDYEQKSKHPREHDRNNSHENLACTLLSLLNFRTSKLAKEWLMCIYISLGTRQNSKSNLVGNQLSASFFHRLFSKEEKAIIQYDPGQFESLTNWKLWKEKEKVAKVEGIVPWQKLEISKVDRTPMYFVSAKNAILKTAIQSFKPEDWESFKETIYPTMSTSQKIAVATWPLITVAARAVEVVFTTLSQIAKLTVLLGMLPVNVALIYLLGSGGIGIGMSVANLALRTFFPHLGFSAPIGSFFSFAHLNKMVFDGFGVFNYVVAIYYTASAVTILEGALKRKAPEDLRTAILAAPLKFTIENAIRCSKIVGKPLSFIEKSLDTFAYYTQFLHNRIYHNHLVSLWNRKFTFVSRARSAAQ